MQQLCWQLGNGQNIKFWTDTWTSQPLVNLINFPIQLLSRLIAKVKDFICNGSWHIPDILLQKILGLGSELEKVTIPTSSCDDL